MQRIKMDLENLTVDSFQTEAETMDAGFGAQDPAFMAAPGGGYCCTGCVSGCGYNPTASGCASGGTEPFAMAM
jgi:hypothetical protein